MWQPPPAPPVLPVEPTGYHQFWRVPGIAVWRPIVVTLITGVVFFLTATVVTGLAVTIEIAAGTLDPDDLFIMLDEARMTPGLVLGNSVAIGLMVPLTLLIARLVKQPPRFLHSVMGRFRWKWFWACVGTCVAVLGVSTVAELAVTGVEDLDLQIHPYTWWLLIGLMLVTPFQAAAEEYMLRGVLFRTVSSWFRQPLVALAAGTLVNAVIFMFMHGASDPWLNLVYFVMGALLSWITWRTGGLEAAVAFHIVNNMIAFSLVSFQDVSGVFDRSIGAAGPIVLVQLMGALVVMALMAKVAGMRSVERAAPALER